LGTGGVGDGEDSGTCEVGNLKPIMDKTRLMAKIMPHRTKSTAIASGGIKGIKGKEITILLTYHDTAEKLSIMEGIVTQNMRPIVQRNFFSRSSMYPLTKITFAIPMIK
jgi:hypothetical protein